MDLKVISEQVSLEHALRSDVCLAHEAVSQRLSLNDEHIEVAVVVVVQQADAWRHELGIEHRARHAVEVHEVEAGLCSPIDEPLAWFSDLLRRCRTRRYQEEAKRHCSD